MEDEERQKKLQAGKAKLAEYRQRKAQADGQKKQKKKKKRRIGVEDSEGDGQGRGEEEQEQSVGEGVPGGGGGGGVGEGERPRASPTTEFTFARTLRSGETVRHDQIYTIEPESEISTTAEDYSSEEEAADPMQKEARGDGVLDKQDRLAAETQAVELEDFRAAFGSEGVRQLQDFEAALRQRDGIITQLTASLQQARQEKDETLREFLELTEQSQKLHIQFQQLQAGETLRNTSHSSTAADLLQTRQQLAQYQQQAAQYQQQVQEMAAQVRGHEERSEEQLLQIGQLQHNLNDAQMVGRRTEESFAQRLNEKELLMAEQQRVLLGHERALKQLKEELACAGRGLEESFTQKMSERDLLISEQTTIVKEHEGSLTQLREELAQVGRTEEALARRLQEKDLLIAQQERAVSERDGSLARLSDQLAASERRLNDLDRQMAAKTQELESGGAELEACRAELEGCKGELSSSRRKERMSSAEIQQLMASVEDLQKRCHRGSLSEGDAARRAEEESARGLEHLRAELDETYGQQIVQMKQELRAQHAADVERLAEEHRAQLELLRSRQPGPEAPAELDAQVAELRERLQEAQGLRLKAVRELDQSAREKLGLQGQVEELLGELRSARVEVEEVSQKLASQEDRRDELLRLRDAVDNLRAQLAEAEAAAEDEATRHESETTNYKIKLDMMEREKDAVLDRMAESQEAELERLRTQLLFSHEEELSVLREDLQRESRLNAENLLNEAAAKHEQLRGGLEDRLRVLEGERAGLAAERDETLRQVAALKEDLSLALHGSRAEELVEQLQELQLEVEELRKEGDRRAGAEAEIQTLLRKNELLENQREENEQRWENRWKEQESEKHILREANDSMNEEIQSRSKRIESLTAENKQMQQQVVELREEIDKQRSTFSFAEKNFEVNYQELKEEYTCLIEVKAQLEERMLKETLEYEAKLSNLQSRNLELEDANETHEASAAAGALMEKDTTELMEKLEVALKDKHCLTARLSEVMERLTATEGEVERLEAELRQVRIENEDAVARNRNLEGELEREREILKERASEVERERLMAAKSKAELQRAARLHRPPAPACSVEDHPLQIASLRGEVEALRSSLRKAETERDRVRPAPGRRVAAGPSPAAKVQGVGQGPVEGGGASSKPTGSNRRKRRQRGRQDRQSSAQSGEGGEREEEEGAFEGDDAAEQEAQAAMESRAASRSQRRVSEEDSADGCRGDAVEKQTVGGGMERETAAAAGRRAEVGETAEDGETTQHAECRLQLEAQRVSLSQIHAAQLELLQEQTGSHTGSLEQEPSRWERHQGADEPKALKYQSVLHVVSQDCRKLILSFAKLFGEEFLEYLCHTDVEDWKTQPVEKEGETRDPSSVLQEAKELVRDLQQVKERIEQEHGRLLQLQALLRSDGSKMEALQTAYDELKVNSENEISVLRVQTDISSYSPDKLRDITEQTSPTIPSEGLARLQGQMEERHRQEMERLRSYYQQQATQTEERHATAITLLQQRLQEGAGSEAQISLPTDVQLTSQMEGEDTEDLKLVGEEVGLDAAVCRPVQSAGLTTRLQPLRREPSAEASRLREEQDQRERRLEEDQRERRAEERRAEEDIAKVIVQMSVEFARQSELALAAKRARESTSAMQTEEKEEERGEEQTPAGLPGTLGSLEEVERRFWEQKERLEGELRERTAELGRLQEQLRRVGPPPEQKRGEEPDREQGAEEELKRKRTLGAKVSSQDGGESSTPDVITTERNLLRKANESLRQVLTDVLKTTAAAEETIGRHVEGLLEASSRGKHPSQRPTWHRTAGEPFRPYSGHAGDSTTESCQSSEAGDVSVWSGEMETDEGLDMSQQTPDTLLPGAELQLENEEYLMNISTRLQAAVEKLLVAITETTNQLEHARLTQTELMRESFRHSQEMEELLQRQEELQERLGEEARAREQLALELHRAEGLIDGYTGERAALEEQLRQKEELHLILEQDLQVTSSRLNELEQERLQMLEERELLSRQQDAMRELAGPRELCLVEAVVAAPEADLLEETEKLMKEKAEVQRQAEKDSLDLQKQVKLLEAELEEQVGRAAELEHARRAESADLTQQIQALEKQLEKNRRFLDEQAVDREHERDVFQQEILKLELQLKNPQKLLTGSEQRGREVDQLTSQLKEKADWCSELLLASEQLRQEVAERNEEIDKLEGRIRELEQALLASSETLPKTEDRKPHVSVSEAVGSSLEAQLQTEREALDRKEKEIRNLEEQLEQFREELENKSEEVQQLHMQLEIQRKELSTQQYDLATRDNLFRGMEEKDRQIALLNEQIAKLQHTETASDNKETEEKDELIRDLESQVECLRSEQERLKRYSEEELDQLNAVIDKLQEELANIEQNRAGAEDEAPPDGRAEGPSQEQYDQARQSADLATRELHVLRAEHGSLSDTYRRLKESAVALAGTEDPGELEEALREKTAAFMVMQAELQALERSATARADGLSRRIQELDDLVRERDSELACCRLLVEEARRDADELQRKVSGLEDKLRERVAAALVSQAQLGAVQQRSEDQRTKEPCLDTLDQTDALAHDFSLPGTRRLDLGTPGRAEWGPTGRVVLLTEKLRELEVGLSSMQKDQELQKQLLSSSEEEVLEYERRLAVLMDLLGQMRTKPGGHQRRILSTEGASVSEVLQELQEVRDEAAATREQLTASRESSSRLKAELQAKEIAIGKLQEHLQRASSGGVAAEMSEIHRELREVQEEAAATKEELCSYRERCVDLQQMLQEREMTITHLKGQLHQASSEGEGAARAELLHELQDVRNEASATKEQLSSFRERAEKLQDELRARDLSIGQLREELLQLRSALDTATERPPPSPSPQPSSCASFSQPKKKGSKQQGAKAGVAKDKPSLARKSTAAAGQAPDKPRTPAPNSGPRQSVPRADAASQTEPSRMPGPRLGARSASEEEEEEVREVIGEYREKICQMQELHAAEILDMEARHIAESEALRRDGQLLEEECRALRAALDKLRPTEAPSSRPDRPATLQFKDGYTSDSSSDWSQRTGYDLPHLQQEFRTTPEGARRETDEALPDRIKVLLREVHQEGMQVLSLSELPLAEGEADPGALVQGSAKDRESLVATVESLKHLITLMQTHRETQTPGGGADWRADLLGAVQQVFVRERGVLKSALYARLDLLDTSDAVVHLNQLERRLAEQDSHHREAMGNLHAADRSSLLSEIRQLRIQLEQLSQNLPHSQGVHSGVQSGVQEPRERVAPQGGPQDPRSLQAERLILDELRGELTQTKLELETTLKAQHKHLKELDTLRAEVSQKAAEVETLTDRLSEQQRKSREQQWALEKERCRSDKKDQTEGEALEDLSLALEDQQTRVAQLTSALDQERHHSAQLSLQSQQERLGLQSRLSELQVRLESECARAQELDAALGREKELRRPGGAPGVGEEGGGGRPAEGGVMSFQAVLEGLQRELDEKHAKVVGLLGQVEDQKLEAVRREEELTSTGQRSWRDQEALREARARLEALEEQAREAEAQLEREAQRRRALEQEKDRLEERAARLGERREGERTGGAQQDDGHKQAPWRGEPTDRTRDWVFQQKTSDAQTGDSSTPSPLGGTGRGTTAPHDPRRTADTIMGKLHLIATKVRAMASRGTGRLTTEVDSEELSWLQSNIDEVIALLQQSPGLPSVPESAALQAGGSSSLTERLLRQNAELTGFVSRLTQEKNDLRNQALRLEEELRRYHQAGLSVADSAGSRHGVEQLDAASGLLSQEREAWDRERGRLEKALRLAQAELARLRGEIRTESLRDLAGPEADNATLKRMYGKYLRSESFRKALIYQKKYLLLLLGGFQECEEATLALIGRMGGRPSAASLESLTHRRGLTRFRSAVRVSIALSRMRFLVRRWQKATGLVSTPSASVNRNGLTLTLGSEARDAAFLQPGSVEGYGERRGGATRGRSGRNSPRSALSSAQHRFHMADDGSLTCSHLQNYDPDRALTDYISRLEALQRRLGNVTSGSSSYGQLHFGMRR